MHNCWSNILIELLMYKTGVSFPSPPMSLNKNNFECWTIYWTQYSHISYKFKAISSMLNQKDLRSEIVNPNSHKEVIGAELLTSPKALMSIGLQ